MRKAAEGGSPAEILWNLGLFLTLRAESDEAVEVYAAALEENHDVAESWSRLGSALFQANRPAEAREAFLRALEMDPGLAEARYQLGFALSALGDFDGALRETKRALEQEPVFPPPRYRLLIDIQFDDGSLPAPDTGETERVEAGAAIPTFEFRAEELDRAFGGFHVPDPRAAREEGDLQALLEEARTALRRGLPGRAAERVGRALALAPDAAEPLLLHGEVFLRQGL
ncbi:MAG: tetratricopeptide repeat protein, partial [Gemmatimonadetes bacterium]|nr:tetratricopeptide repeat protein [Gemmatimonadota bacterium]NIQ56334.1 tetratricopeptide repeat protein [Gemmatimonadota bacterium]NIU76524.1 tetratricopeptide repeat protein [Gammaproteobacteria bacterium]NIX45987.1 tetratricopeptide repeat protein [Gemmatimonadota bacterium]NIY10305.1 tetratricopeptide repeat protein [Gemmatimonadota bacterium]